MYVRLETVSNASCDTPRALRTVRSARANEGFLSRFMAGALKLGFRLVESQRATTYRTHLHGLDRARSPSVDAAGPVRPSRQRVVRLTIVAPLHPDARDGVGGSVGLGGKESPTGQRVDVAREVTAARGRQASGRGKGANFYGSETTVGTVLYCGDPHGRFDHILHTASQLPTVPIVLLGDLGLQRPLREELADIAERVWFIHGNHDTDSDLYATNI